MNSKSLYCEKKSLPGNVSNDFCSLEIRDLPYQRKYYLNLNVSVCFESRGSCEISVPVLTRVALPKAECDWSRGIQGNTFRMRCI